VAGCQTPPESSVLQTSTLTPSPFPTATPTPIPSVTPTPTPIVFTPSEIFDRIAPSVAHLATSIATGSGFLIDGGYVVTNAHVVWPYASVRVTFPNQTPFEEVPVLGWDLIADIAIIGPLETDLPPLHPMDGESYVVGSEVFLIGYPGGQERHPQPTISRGLISRKREWKRPGITFFQTDAKIAGGQSGGVLVSERGEVIGMSGLRFADAQFGLIASAADIMPRVKAIIAGEQIDDLNRKPISKGLGGEKEVSVQVKHAWDMNTFLLWPEEGDEVHLEMKGPEDLVFWIRSAAGALITGPDPQTDVFFRELAFRSKEAPLFVVALNNLALPESGELSASHPLILFSDPDDGRELDHRGETITGAMDYPGDIDVFLIPLKKDETIRVRIESIMLDPFGKLSLLHHPPADSLAEDNNSGKGVIGTDAEFAFRAPGDDQYVIIVRDFALTNIGGYFLSVEKQPTAGPTPFAPTPTPTPLSTDIGPLQRYQYPFSPRYTVYYPADWQQILMEPLCSEIATCFGNTWNSMFVIVSSSDDPLSTLPPDEMAKKLLADIARDDEDVEIVNEQALTNDNHLDFYLIHARLGAKFKHLWLAATKYQRTPILLVFFMTDVDGLQAEDEEQVSPENYHQRYPGGADAFDALVREVISLFNVTP